MNARPATDAEHHRQHWHLVEAKKRVTRTSNALKRAIAELHTAQEQISTVEGRGSSDIYRELAENYAALATLHAKVQAMRPTGLFRL